MVTGHSAVFGPLALVATASPPAPPELRGGRPVRAHVAARATVPVWLLSTGARGARSSGTGVSSHAGLMGLTRQARSEAPQSQLPIIDLDVLRPGMTELAAVSKLAGKLGLGYNGTPEPEMAFDGSSQRVSRLTEAAGSLGGPIRLHFDARGAVSNLRLVPQEGDESEPAHGEVRLRVGAVDTDAVYVLSKKRLASARPKRSASRTPRTPIAPWSWNAPTASEVCSCTESPT